MQTAPHAGALALGHILAPGPSKTPVASLAQYAVSSWSKGGVLLLLAIVALAVIIAAAFRKTRGSQG